MTRAFIFPGQGSQSVGMGKDFYDSFLVAKEVFQEADDLLNIALSKMIFEGPQELLTQTQHSQLAIFVTSTAILKVLHTQFPDLVPTVCSGLSLGEYTALFASQRLGFKETLLLVQKRAFWMNKSCEESSGAMAAVLGLSSEGISNGVKELEGVWVANFNAPGQTVISGTKEGIEKASIALKRLGAKRVIPLDVHGAFHSGLMQMAQNALTPFVEETILQDSPIDFVMNVPGDYVKDSVEIKRYLIEQVTSPVKWEQGMDSMKRAGMEVFVEIGFGKTLAGLNRKIGASLTLSVGEVKDLEEIYAAT